MRFFHKEQKTFDPQNKVRFEFYFTGTVQNIGFRYEILQRAHLYHLTGWAKNNEDGSVTAQLQGNEKDIDKCIRSLQEIDRITFTNISKQRIDILPEFDFQIRY